MELYLGLGGVVSLGLGEGHGNWVGGGGIGIEGYEEANYVTGSYLTRRHMVGLYMLHSITQSS